MAVCGCCVGDCVVVVGCEDGGGGGAPGAFGLAGVPGVLACVGETGRGGCCC